MIGTGIRKYAEAHGMTCDGGYAYGVVHGLHIALEDGYGTKSLQVYLCPPTKSAEYAESLDAARDVLLDCDAKRYRLSRQDPVTVEAGRAIILFHDNAGTMERVGRYIDEVLPRLDAPGSMRCAYCGEPLDAGAQRIAFDGCVLPVHADCAQEMSERAEAIAARPARGSVARGAVGALAGALIGAIPWAVVFVLGYVTSLIGLLIGFLSNLLYGKFGGKNCRLRIAVVVLVVLIGVAAGQVGGYTIDFMRSYGSAGGYEITGLTRTQFVQTQWDWILLTNSAEVLGRQYDRQIENIPEDARSSLISREEYIDRTLSDEFLSTLSDARAEFWTNAAMGAFFGLLGCCSVFAQLFKQTRKRTVRILK